jgi:hypothetical protein
MQPMLLPIVVHPAASEHDCATACTAHKTTTARVTTQVSIKLVGIETVVPVFGFFTAEAKNVLKM